MSKGRKPDKRYREAAEYLMKCLTPPAAIDVVLAKPRFKSVADIAGKMRGLVKPGETLEHTYELLNGLADRLEAVSERERGEAFNRGVRAKEKLMNLTLRKPGNPAKMRAAVVETKKFLEAALVNGKIAGAEITRMMAVVNAALSDPPRNCEVMSLADARKVWFAKEILPRLAGDLPLGREIPFEEWFVTPATAKKGGGE